MSTYFADLDVSMMMKTMMMEMGVRYLTEKSIAPKKSWSGPGSLLKKFFKTFFLNRPIPNSFRLFSLFSHSNSNDRYWLNLSHITRKSVDGVLGIRTLGHSMVGADDSRNFLCYKLFDRIYFKWMPTAWSCKQKYTP